MSNKEIENRTVSVVIPVINAERYLPQLLKNIFSQKPNPPCEIILVDSESTDSTKEIALTFPGVKVIPIVRFSHGRSRNLGVQAASGEIIVFMSQDALPMNDNWLSSLISVFADDRVGAAYSRQIPRADASPPEKFFLQTHFPSGDIIRRVKNPDSSLTFQNVFFSNVSSAARRKLLIELPFDEELIMSEDQQFARDLLTAGHAIVYQPESMVLHSHNYTLTTVSQRYFDSVYSLTRLFSEHDMGTSASIGLKYLVKEAAYIIKRHPLYIPRYIFYTMAKATGTITGHFADKMPRAWAKKLSMHSYHWE